MIRFFLLTGVVGGLVTAWLTTAGVGPVSQLPPEESLLTKFREEGYLPEDPSLEEDHEAEEMEVFELPPEDEERVKQAEAAYEKMMGGMKMGGMDMGSSAPAGAEGSAGMKMAGDEGTGSATMSMGEGAGTTPGTGTMTMAGNGGDAQDGGEMKMAADGAGMEMGEGGLLVSEDGPFDREIVLTMSEWTFSDMKIDVKPGERIRFTVKNGGQIPHEFMFMSPPLMNAVKYRINRADWSLFEHEALFEKALVLPGGEFSFVLQVTQPGTWMFMCMLPYHMEMGMMGQMATEGMAMDM